MELARELMRTCWAMYATTESGLSPEIAWFETDPGDLGIVVAKIQSLGKKTSSSSLLMHTICSVRKPWRVSSWCFVFPTTLSIGSGDGRCLRLPETHDRCWWEGIRYTCLNDTKVPPPQRHNIESF
jgi:mannosyl-oligosaccharide alpha-1,2-mannosidase